MAPSAPARMKLYPYRDPRYVYTPTLPVAGAIAPRSTTVINVTCPQRDTFVVSQSTGSGGSGGSGEHATTHFELQVNRPMLPMSKYSAMVFNRMDEPVMTVRAEAKSRRGSSVFHIYDESTFGSTKGMPRRIPLYTISDRGHLSPDFYVDAVVVKLETPILRIRIEEPVSHDAVWTMRDMATDRTAASMYDFIPDPNVPPTATLKVEPPFSNHIPFMLSMWAIICNLYATNSAAKRRRR